MATGSSSADRASGGSICSGQHATVNTDLRRYRWSRWRLRRRVVVVVLVVLIAFAAAARCAVAAAVAAVINPTRLRGGGGTLPAAGGADLQRHGARYAPAEPAQGI